MRGLETTDRNATSVSLVIAAYVVVAVPLAWYLNIWSDEGSSLFTTEHGFWPAFQNAAAFERQAPLYFWFLSIWREIDGSIFFARIASILACACAIWIFSKISSRFFAQRTGLLATLFFGFHPVLFWAGTEIRVYAFVILISVVLLYLFLKEFIDDSELGGGYRLLFTLIAVLALYTNYYIGFLLAGFFIALLVTRRWTSARKYALIMIPVGIACLPLVPILAPQLRPDSPVKMEGGSFIDGVRVIWGYIADYVLPADRPLGEGGSFLSLMRLWLVRFAVILAACLAIRRRRNLSSLTFTLAAAVGTVLTLFVLVYIDYGLQFVLLRHATVLFAPFVLLLASFLNDVGPVGYRNRTVMIAITTALVCVFFSYTLVNRYGDLAKRGDWARVGSFIERNESAGQPILVFRPYDALTLPYEYHGVNEIVPRDHFLDFGLQSPTSDSIRQRTDFATSSVPPNADELWLITNDECISGGRCAQLESYVARNFDTVADQDFFTQRVRLLRRKRVEDQRPLD